jgi:hypothetical protein
VSGLVIAAVYTLGVLGILLAVPLRELSLVTGTWDALEALGRQWGSAGGALVLALGVGFLYACVANIVTWSLGVNRVAAAAAAEGACRGRSAGSIPVSRRHTWPSWSWARWPRRSSSATPPSPPVRTTSSG